MPLGSVMRVVGVRRTNGSPGDYGPNTADGLHSHIGCGKLEGWEMMALCVCVFITELRKV